MALRRDIYFWFLVGAVMKKRQIWPIVMMAALPLGGCFGENVVTHSEVQRILPGMPIAQVEGVIGVKGDPAPCAGLDGVIEPDPGEVVFCWRNKNGSGVSIATRNGRVIAKSESGLR